MQIVNMAWEGSARTSVLDYKRLSLVVVAAALVLIAATVGGGASASAYMASAALNRPKLQPPSTGSARRVLAEPAREMVADPKPASLPTSSLQVGALSKGSLDCKGIKSCGWFRTTEAAAGLPNLLLGWAPPFCKLSPACAV